MSSGFRAKGLTHTSLGQPPKLLVSQQKVNNYHPPIARPQDLLILGPSNGEGSGRASSFSSSRPRPLALSGEPHRWCLKPIQKHFKDHPEIRHEPSLQVIQCRTSSGNQSEQELKAAAMNGNLGRAATIRRSSSVVLRSPMNRTTAAGSARSNI